jgi:hypothetical protein
MLKILHTISFLIAVTFTYAQTKKNKVNVKFNMEQMLHISKIEDWRINDMDYTNQTLEFGGNIIPSLYINKNEKWEIGLTICNINQQYFLKDDPNWQQKVRYRNSDSLLMLTRTLFSTDFSFGYNIKHLIFKSGSPSQFIKRSNLYLALAAKLIFLNRNYRYYNLFSYGDYPHYLAAYKYYSKSLFGLRPKIEMAYSFDVFKWLQLRANVNYSYIFHFDIPFMVQAGIGFKF